MKKFITLLALFFNFMCFSQYSGKIIDKENQPISFANIIAYNTDNKLITGVVSDDNGEFSINPKEKDFYLKISFIGFKTEKITPKNKNLGTIILKEEGENLEEVTITSRKKILEQKVDRLVFNVENSVTSKGGTAIDALKNTPSLNVEQENLSIIGKGSVRVLVNDRIVRLSGKELISYLNSIPSDDVKKIEVINTPPSKYEAEGDNGLINIVLKKTKENSWNNQIRTSYRQGVYPSFSVGNTFNYNKNKLSISASVTGKKGQRIYQYNGTIDYPNAPWQTDMLIKNKRDNFSGRFSLDYNLTEKSSIGFSYSNNLIDKVADNNGKTDIYDNKKSYLINKGITNGDSKNNNVNVHFIQKLDTLGRKLSVDVDYFNFKESSKNRFSSERFVTNNYFFKADNNSDREIENYSVKIDMEHPSKIGNFSYGGKLSSTKNNSNLNFYNLSSGTAVFDKNKSNEFEYKETIKALYADYSTKISKKLQAKVGLRLEHTNTKGYSKTINQTNENEYTKLFPTLFLSYTANQNNMFNFSYNKRIRRPSFWHLNPFRKYTNANSFVEGNPFLKPQFSDNFKLKHIYKGKLISEIFVNNTTDSYGQAIIIDKNKNIERITQENYFTMLTYGFSETLIYNPTKWWSTVSVITGYKAESKYTKQVMKAKLDSSWGFNLYNKHTFTLNPEKTIQLEATFNYSTPSKVLFVKQSQRFTTDLALNFALLDKKLNCTISANDIFKTGGRTFYSKINGMNQTFYNYYDTQNFKISLTYSFGNKKIRTKKHKSGNDDEQNRIN